MPKTFKLPKRVGGVKLPKKLRKKVARTVDATMARAASPDGRRALAGLAMAAGTAALAQAGRAARASEPPSPSAASTPPAAPTPPGAPMSPAAIVPPSDTPPAPPPGAALPPEIDTIVDAFSQATAAFMDGLRGRKR